MNLPLPLNIIFFLWSLWHQNVEPFAYTRVLESYAMTRMGVLGQFEWRKATDAKVARESRVKPSSKGSKLSGQVDFCSRPRMNQKTPRKRWFQQLMVQGNCQG